MIRSAVTLAVLIVATSPGKSADVTINASEFPVAALQAADELIPKLAEALKSCSIEDARAVHEKVHDFVYKQWGWNANYEKLKPYLVCFRMLSNIADTTGLITNRYSVIFPRAVAGPFDANYSACRSLADPSYDLKGVVINAQWPERFGAEPRGKRCAR